MRIVLVMCGVLLGYIGLSWAQDAPSPPDQPSSSVKVSAPLVPTPTSVPKVEKKSADQPIVQSSQALPQDSSSVSDPNTFKKEQRLEALRYRHLWIAFSLVWLITLVFVYRTWQRSQAVASRLDELKARLAQVENKD